MYSYKPRAEITAKDCASGPAKTRYRDKHPDSSRDHGDSMSSEEDCEVTCDDPVDDDWECDGWKILKCTSDQEGCDCGTDECYYFEDLCSDDREVQWDVPTCAYDCDPPPPKTGRKRKGTNMSQGLKNLLQRAQRDVSEEHRVIKGDLDDEVNVVPSSSSVDY